MNKSGNGSGTKSMIFFVAAALSAGLPACRHGDADKHDAAQTAAKSGPSQLGFQADLEQGDGHRDSVIGQVALVEGQVSEIFVGKIKLELRPQLLEQGAWRLKLDILDRQSGELRAQSEMRLPPAGETVYRANNQVATGNAMKVFSLSLTPVRAGAAQVESAG